MSDHEHAQDSESGIGLTFERVLDVLRCGEISNEYGLMRWSSNYTFLVSVTHQDLTLTAVYKPQQGERPLWDFPDGTLCYREQAAFLTSTQLGWQLVPPTVLREGSRGLGTMQFYIDHDPEQNYFTFDESIRPQLMRLSAFDYIINNADRKGGHCLLDQQGHLWGIDHGITFHSAPKLRTVIWDFAGEQVPDRLVEDLEQLAVQLEDSDSGFHQSLRELLSANEINTFRARVKQMVKNRRFPLPGSGPNYPWPPV